MIYKKIGGTSKTISTTLAVYDETRLIYEKHGSITLGTFNELINFINKKYGVDFKIIKNGGSK